MNNSKLWFWRQVFLIKTFLETLVLSTYILLGMVFLLPIALVIGLSKAVMDIFDSMAV